MSGIPSSITIKSADPAATAERIKAAFEECRKRLWYMHHTLLPVDGIARWIGSGPTLESIGFLTIEEHEGRSFQEPITHSMVAGYYTAGGPIHFAKDSPFDPLSHELGHHVALVTGVKGWGRIGHGTADDPYILATHEVMRLYYGAMWGTQHTYMKAALRQIPAPEAGWCYVGGE